MRELTPFSSDLQESMIIHIPHAGTQVPDLESFLIEDELLLSTDWYTDKIFETPLKTIKAKMSRIFVDVERFLENDPMEKYGRGFFYTKDVKGIDYTFVKNKDDAKNEYKAYHEYFTNTVRDKLKEQGHCLIFDCHSFNNEPLYFEPDGERPDICIGTDSFHTPPWLIQTVTNHYKDLGYSVETNFPYAGSIVPLEFYKKNEDVLSVMVEINKKLYMKDELDISIKKLNKEFIELIKKIM